MLTYGQARRRTSHKSPQNSEKTLEMQKRRITPWVILFLGLNSFAQKEILQGSVEVHKVQDQIAELCKDPHRDEKKIQALRDYLRLLKAQIVELNPGPGKKPYLEFEITSKMRDRILGMLAEIRPQFQPPLTLKSIYDLVEHIETHKKHWRKAGASEFEPFSVFTEDDREIKVSISLDSLGLIYLKFGSSPLGRGASNVIYKVVNYKTWAKLAEKKLRPDQVNKENQFKKEQWVLEKINSLPAAQREGFVETFSIEDHRFIQALYAGSLETVLDPKSKVHSPELKKNRDLKLKGLHQVSLALAQLHEMGLSHQDLKPDNILVGSDLDFVLSDFDLAFAPRPIIQQGKPRKEYGNFFYGAPEFASPSWTGKSDTEKEKNALKADVFSLAQITYELTHSEKFPGVIPCEQAKKKEYRKCRADELKKYIEQVAKNSDYSSLEILLYAALQPNPEHRIDSQKYARGLQYVLNKKPDLSSKGTLSEVLKNSQVVNMSEDEISDYLNSSEPGNYILHPYPTSEGMYRLAVSYLDLDHKIQWRKLDVDPRNSKQVEDELEFLNTLGILQKSVKIK